jgi:hypothetical protein
MNRPHIDPAKWIFPSYQHFHVNAALSAKAKMNRMKSRMEASFAMGLICVL